MRFKQFYLLEISDFAIQQAKSRLAGLVWISKLSIDQLKSYKQEHPEAKKSTLTYIQKEIMFREQKKRVEDHESLLDKYKEFHNKNKIEAGIDISSAHPVEIQDAVEKAESKKSRSEIKKDAEKVYENDKIVVIKPITHAASCKYGSNTKWCTTAKEDTYFNSYTKKGALYYIIPKDGSDKTAIYKYASEGIEAFNAEDRSVDPKSIIDRYKIPEKILVGDPTWKFSWESTKGQNDIDCSDNRLTSLEGAPKTVGGNFDCSDNQLTSLEGAPTTVGGNFNCSDNQLTSLEGTPKTVGGNFDCFDNQLTSLEGAPKTVGGNFYCYNNQLTSLEGAPKEVSGNFSCFDNRLTSLEGAPKKVSGNFDCSNNKVKFTEAQIRAVCKVKGKVYC